MTQQQTNELVDQYYAFVDQFYGDKYEYNADDDIEITDEMIAAANQAAKDIDEFNVQSYMDSIIL